MSREQFDADQAERVRRIQEEIRRKIAERRGQATPPPLAPPPSPPRLPQRPVYGEEPPLTPTWQPALPPVQPPRLPPREVPSYDDSAALERQRRLD